MCIFLIGANGVNYADKIKRLRMEMLLTQAEFASFLGVSFESVNRWENGKSNPTMKTRRRLKELFEQYKI